MTLFDVTRPIQRAFDVNLSDWYRGGPKLGGWTRTGPPLPQRKAVLTHYSFQMIGVDEVLAKNPAETAKWHISFLKQHDVPEHTLYYQEYALPQFGDMGVDRYTSFLELYHDIKKNGVVRSVWVADLADLDLGFRYFRFNGCHRTCAAKVLGIKEVPALVFKAVAL
jgi:hypothetical protein